MRPREINKLVEDYIGTTDSGYLKYFSYSTHDRFYHHYCDVEVDVQSYRDQGLSTRKAFIAILKDLDARSQAKVIRGTFEMIPTPENPIDEDDIKRVRIHNELLSVAAQLESDVLINLPAPVSTSEVVYLALQDAETLLSTSGPVRAVDRAHTALHGYLKHLCDQRKITLPDDASLTYVFKIVREQFPEFSGPISHDEHAKRLFGSLAGALDSLNTIRNRGSMAHPNELLIDGAEAMLYINLSRAVISYLESRL
jgi:hypothetical protein